VSGNDRAFARRLGFEFRESGEFFGDPSAPVNAEQA
jgi:hypothetical protein